MGKNVSYTEPPPTDARGAEKTKAGQLMTLILQGYATTRRENEAYDGPLVVAEGLQPPASSSGRMHTPYFSSHREGLHSSASLHPATAAEITWTLCTSRPARKAGPSGADDLKWVAVTTIQAGFLSARLLGRAFGWVSQREDEKTPTYLDARCGFPI